MIYSEETVLKSLFAAASGVTELPVAETGTSPARDLWPDFLQSLAQMSGGDGAGLVQLRGTAVGQSWAWGHAVPQFERDTYERLRSQRVYSQTDLPAYQAGEIALRVLRWRVDATSHAVIWVARHGTDFRARDGVGLTRLAPYLGPALISWQALQAERLRARKERQIGQDLGGFWLRFSGAGRVLAQSEGLAQRLEGTALHITEQGWPEFATPDLARQFRATLGQIAPISGEVVRTAGMLDLSLARPLQLVLRADPSAMSVLGLLRQPRAASELGENHVMQFYGLARNEARLAICLCDGLSLNAAGEALGWSRETARSYSKQLYARLGVSGQTGVLRLMLGGAIWF
ncbi:helix-turn-helix transcriptional regulator [Thioclava sp. GXIMD4215]|uniref:helix-turn-helix transcriptional regulator n=1 Tax=Thioclava sp. GXIMD4215 TaxID=3131928 RepID=UPI00324DF6D7